MEKENLYTVWVGDTEVTDYYVTLNTAERIKTEYISDGYDDVEIEKIN